MGKSPKKLHNQTPDDIVPLERNGVLELMQRLRDDFRQITQTSIAAAIDELAAAKELPLIERIASLSALHAYIVQKLGELEKPDLPSKAPELWVARADKSEKPADFIRRVYGSFPIKGISRAYFRSVDPILHKALTDWLKQNPMPEDLGFITSKQRTDARLQALMPHLRDHPLVREAERLRAAEQKRKQRSVSWIAPPKR